MTKENYKSSLTFLIKKKETIKVKNLSASAVSWCYIKQVKRKLFQINNGKRNPYLPIYSPWCLSSFLNQTGGR